jgi:hypothetical protein
MSILHFTQPDKPVANMTEIYWTLFLKNKQRRAWSCHELRTQPTITDWFTSILNAIHSCGVHSWFSESIVCKYKSARRERIIITVVTGRAVRVLLNAPPRSKHTQHKVKATKS